MMWIVTLTLYALGLYALHCMSADFSTTSRSTKTIIGLALWPLTTAFAAVADAWEFFERKFL